MITLRVKDGVRVQALLEQLRQEVAVELALVLDKGGTLVAESSDHGSLDLATIGALAAGVFAATNELAQRLGDSQSSALVHHGSGHQFLMVAIDQDFTLFTFGPGISSPVLNQPIKELIRSLSEALRLVVDD